MKAKVNWIMGNYRNSEHWMEEDGIFLSRDWAVDTLFNDRQQHNLFKIEEKSWWFQYRADVILSLMDRFFKKKSTTLDVGGGNGYTSIRAVRAGYRMGIIEPNRAACNNAKKRGIHEVNCGSVTDQRKKHDSVEQMLLLDVLEHIEDDRGFLKTLKRKLVYGGCLVITVPAFMCLWSSEDDTVGHFRRYRIKQLSTLLRTCGFDICYQSYFMGFLFVPILVIRVMLERIGLLKRQEDMSEEERERIFNSQFKKRSGLVSVVLPVFENFEKRLLRKPNRVLFGSSIIVVVRKGE